MFVIALAAAATASVVKDHISSSCSNMFGMPDSKQYNGVHNKSIQKMVGESVRTNKYSNTWIDFV